MGRRTLPIFCLAVWSCACGAGTPTAPTKEPFVPDWQPPSLAVDGPVGILIPGESVQLRARRIENTGLTVTDVTTSCVWTSSDLSVASLGSTGLATAVGVGTAGVTATSEGLCSTIEIRVAGSHGSLSGQIDPEVAADLVQYNQYHNMITRFDLPIRVFIDPAFSGVLGDFGQRAVAIWQSATRLPVMLVDVNEDPVLEFTALRMEVSRAKAGVAVRNLDNSIRRAKVIVPTAWSGMHWNTVGFATVHEVGHALGIWGHPPWAAVMDPGAPTDVPNQREVRLLVELYKLPIGAHVEPDGTWVVW